MRLAPGRLLGAPGPENLASPILSSAVKASLVDTQAPSTAAPNRVRDFTPVTNGPSGTPTIRRRFKNAAGLPVTALRFRIVDITPQGTPNTCGACTLADLRVLSSNDTSAQLTNGSTVTIRGTLLEQAALQPTGGLNSAVTGALPGGALSPGGSINVQFVLGVQQSGTFRFFINAESLSTATGSAPQRTDGKLSATPPGKF